MAKPLLLSLFALLAACKTAHPGSDLAGAPGGPAKPNLVTLQQQVEHEAARISQQTDEGSMSIVVTSCESTGAFAQEHAVFELGTCVFGYRETPTKYRAIVREKLPQDEETGPLVYQVVRNKPPVTLAQQINNERARLSQQTAEGSMQFSDATECKPTGLLQQEANSFETGTCVIGYPATGSRYLVTVRLQQADLANGVLGGLVYEAVRIK